MAALVVLPRGSVNDHGGERHVHQGGNVSGQSYSSLVDVLFEKWGRCPHAGGHDGGCCHRL